MHLRFFRSGILVATVSLAAAACSHSGDSPSPSPAAIALREGNNQSGTVGQPLTSTLSVVVTSASGKPIKSYPVTFDVSPGGGSVSPAQATTNASGVATTTWTVGTVAGTMRVAAQVGGLEPVVFTATVVAGAPASVVALPATASLGVGDTLRLRASVRDSYGNTISGSAITFTSLDVAVASVNSSTGLVTALVQGTARVVADASGRADTVPITVGAAGTSLCGTTAPVTLTLGQVQSPASSATGVTTCLSAPGDVNAEYAIALVNPGSAFGTATYVDLVAIGNTGPTVAALTAQEALGTSATVGEIPIGAAVDDRNTERATELARRQVERTELTPLVDDARTWLAARDRYTALVTTPAVGDQIKLNANANLACSSPDTRTGRVAAVSSRAMVVTDVSNPDGGYTDADYAGILATFDTLVFPMDTAAFGAPSNISQYGRIILFYTRAVNELTPRNASYLIGGFFFARDLYPKKANAVAGSCPASNENEMFYLLVPDPNGVINGNKRTKDEVTTSNLTVIAHELQHLINASRRLYVNTGAETNEETWLDEGLAHVAEELLYFRISGFSARQNLTLQDVAATSTRQTQFSTYASSNFFRFYRYIAAPESNSPYAPNDSLSTRGATWNFLRFAAARQGAGNEAAFFHALVNSRTTGVANLQGVLTSGGFNDYLLDWTVSLIADDFSTAETAALDTRYINPAWNFRSIFPGLRQSGGAVFGVYPIAARSLTSSAPQRVVLPGGASSFIRFGIPAGRSAIVNVSSNGQTLPTGIRWALVRLR